ncbi:radical SAM protein [Maridesulfovibrio ferrireducens]|uniref:radical SAM protein n=1 Tax=Maridesulfovibrio ferrireducens TaxID=246191 RepID=UPI001A2492AD|nr:radical SAM protein [Maridesulfovibrio ferrireducens]MBI9113107.1 radical SAM protein [Maridesulfovibrio ferrireducens]
MYNAVFKNVFFEISGACNAKCPWCQTGIKARNGLREKAHFVDLEDFRKVIRKMRIKKLISPKTQIALYNWFEPFLHPQFKEIIADLHRIEQPFSLSTNASKLILFSDNELTHCTQLRISLPGFSQASYDRVHGFTFERILENIVKMVKNFRENGFKGSVVLAFLVYQFNIGEIAACHAFAKQLGVRMTTGVAAFNGFSMMQSYLKNTMPYSQLKEASKDLFLYYIDDTIANCPPDWECPQHEFLVIDEHCNAAICCGPDKDHSEYLVGNMLELSTDEIVKRKKAKKKSPTCKECMALGMPFLGSNLPHI